METATALPIRYERTSVRRGVGLLLVYICGLFLLHVLPFGGMGPTRDDLGSLGLDGLRTDYLIHIAMFLLWGFVAAGPALRRRQPQFHWAVFGLGLTVAAAAEGAQYWLPYRSFNWLDLGLNLTGVVAGYILLIVWRTVRTRDPHAEQKSYD